MSVLELESAFLEYPVGSGNFFGGVLPTTSVVPALNMSKVSFGPDHFVFANNDALVLTERGLIPLIDVQVNKDYLITTVPSVLKSWFTVLSSELENSREAFRERHLLITGVERVDDGVMVPAPTLLSDPGNPNASECLCSLSQNPCGTKVASQVVFN